MKLKNHLESIKTDLLNNRINRKDFSCEIRKIGKNIFIFKEAKTHSELEQVFRLRYKVYCQERKYLNATDYPHGKEVEKNYDSNAIHIVAENQAGEVVGTVRLVKDSNSGLPMEKNFRLPSSANGEHRVEISRLAITNDVRGLKQQIAQGLYKIIYKISKERNTTHWYAMIDKRLCLILDRMGIRFKKIGKPRWYLGSVVVPSLLIRDEMMDDLRKENLELHDYFAGN